MALPSSGVITMAQVNTELGLSSSSLITLNDTRVRLLANVPSGAIGMNNLYGKQVPTLVNTASPASTGSTSATINFGSVSTGSAAANRTIIVLVTGASGTGNRGINTATLNGFSMTRIVGATTSNSGSAASAIFCLPWPTGTTAQLIIGITANLNPVVPTVLAAYGLNSATPYSFGSDTSPGTTLNPNTVAVATNYDGIIVASSAARSSGITYSGITERRDTGVGSTAWDSNTGFSSSSTISQFFAGSTASLCVASWR